MEMKGLPSVEEMRLMRKIMRAFPGSARHRDLMKELDETRRSAGITIEDKPAMPAHDYARQYASDTLSGREDGKPFECLDRNLAKCYIDLCRCFIPQESFEQFATRQNRSLIGMPDEDDDKGHSHGWHEGEIVCSCGWHEPCTFENGQMDTDLGWSMFYQHLKALAK